MGAIALHGMHLSAPRSTRRGSLAVAGAFVPLWIASPPIVLIEATSGQHTHPASRLPEVIAQAPTTTHATIIHAPFFDTVFISPAFTFHVSIISSGSTTISDFTELATRLYFCAACSARRVRASIVVFGSPPAAM